ncbi:MAG: putative rane protein [Firmicutes bacterium]|nr:putative rane protein [Bacillota bacterium]
MSDMFGAVNVPLAVLWTEPGAKRTHNDLILGPTPNAAAWADTMDTDMRLALVGKVETQVLFGERLLILDHQGDWLKVAAINQATSLFNQGYPGWIPTVQVSSNSTYLKEQLTSPLITVTAPKTLLYQHAAIRANINELSYQTSLPLLAQTPEYYTVRLPNGDFGQLAVTNATYQATTVFNPDNIISEAKKFIGLRYIWGGTSSFGFDCSGFVMRLYGSQGLTIPRDADDQAHAGTAVEITALERGDLLFFADNNGQGTIHHVGMYAGEGRMIHAPNSRSAVREEDYTGGNYGPELWGARRYR